MCKVLSGKPIRLCVLKLRVDLTIYNLTKEVCPMVVHFCQRLEHDVFAEFFFNKGRTYVL